MWFDKVKKPLVVIVGPTAVGKTEAAIVLAERLGGEIVSADSRLFYRGMDIGTAKPSAEDRLRVRHHLIDVANPDETWSLGIFQKEAQAAIADIHQRGKLPFLVGGTGQYVHAVVQEWSVPPVTPNSNLRAVLEAWAEETGKQGLYERLAMLDPVAASRIDYRNLRRTIRALEVIFTTGSRFSAQSQMKPSPYSVRSLGLTRPREDLYRRIDARIDLMLANGWVDEVRSLLAAGYSPDLPALSAIGYREIIASLEGKYSLEEAIIRIRRITRNFVRHQANWFKESDPGIRWFQAGITPMDEIVLKLTADQGWLDVNPHEDQ